LLRDCGVNVAAGKNIKGTPIDVNIPSADGIGNGIRELAYTLDRLFPQVLYRTVRTKSVRF